MNRRQQDAIEIKVGWGCFGCLLQVLSIMGLIWVLTHISEIMSALDGLVR